MNANSTTTPLKTFTIAAVLILATVGCQKAANDALKATPIAVPDKQSEPTDSAKIGFKVWKELVGNYQLTQFNGQSISNRSAEIGQSISRFYDRTEKKYLDSVIFPLYSNVNSGMIEEFKFGPVESKGVTTLTEGEGVKVYTYKYDGLINVEGIDIEMHLDMNVLQEGNNIYVTYTLMVPDQIPSITRNFTLQKN